MFVIDDAIQDRGEGYTVFSIVSSLLTLTPLPLLSGTLAGWGSVPTIRKEAEELRHKGLHG